MQPEAIFRSLVDHEVEYVFVGGLAATAHGVSIITVDTDICFRAEEVWTVPQGQLSSRADALLPSPDTLR